MGICDCGLDKPTLDALAILPGNSILHSAADSVTSAVQKASQALNERGERLGRAEEKTEDMKNSAQQFAETAHKVSQGRGCPCWVIKGHSAEKLPTEREKIRSLFMSHLMGHSMITRA